MILRKHILPLALAVCIATVSQAATWTTIDAPGASRTLVMGINGAGDVVGTSIGNTGTHAFRLKSGVFTTLDPPGAISSHAVGINDSGLVSGWFQSSDQESHGFLYDGANYTILDVPSATDTVAQGINNAGLIVGFYRSGVTKGFKWTNGTFSTVDAPGALSTGFTGADNLRHFVGIYQDFNKKDHNFIQNGEGEFRTLNIKGGGDIFGINDHKIVTGSATKNGVNYGFWYNVQTKHLVKLVFPGAVHTECYGINNDGQIVGNYRTSQTGKTHGFIRTP